MRTRSRSVTLPLPPSRRQALALAAAPLLASLPPPRHGVVVAVSPPAADVGLATLKAGGNAVDAAVATAFALAVTYPSAGNLGGGGFMTVHPAKGRGAPAVIDYREKAPLAASRTMFAPKDTIYSHKAVGVPGTVAGLSWPMRNTASSPGRPSSRRRSILPRAASRSTGNSLARSTGSPPASRLRRKCAASSPRMAARTTGRPATASFSPISPRRCSVSSSAASMASTRVKRPTYSSRR